MKRLAAVLVLPAVIVGAAVIYTWIRTETASQSQLTSRPTSGPVRTDAMERAIQNRAARPGKMVGLTREQILNELGPPDRLNRVSKDDISYCLGPESGFFSIDSRWLMIVFRDGKAIKAVVNTD
jgi:hypothetical protein